MGHCVHYHSMFLHYLRLHHNFLQAVWPISAPGAHPLVRQDVGDLGPERGLEGLFRGMAILRLAPTGNGTIHTPHGPHEWLEVWTLILAIPMGDGAGPLLPLARQVIAVRALAGTHI